MPFVSPWDDIFEETEPPRRDSRAFPLKGGRTFDLTLEELDPLTRSVAHDKARDYCRLYIIQGEPLLDPNGKAFAVSESVLTLIAALETMQQVPDGQAKYGLTDWLGYATRGKALWYWVESWAMDYINGTEDGKPISNGEDDDEGNSSGREPDAAPTTSASAT